MQDALAITGYSVDGGADVEVTDQYSDFAYDVGKDTDNINIKFYVAWRDDGQDSAEQTALGITPSKAIMNVRLSFEQKA